MEAEVRVGNDGHYPKFERKRGIRKSRPVKVNQDQSHTKAKLIESNGWRDDEMAGKSGNNQF